MTPLSIENLLAHDYHSYSASAASKHADGFYQRRIRDEAAKTRYFINVFLFKFPDGRMGWQPELHTSLKSGKYIDLILHSPSSIEDIEEFFELVFTTLDGQDYDDD